MCQSADQLTLADSRAMPGRAVMSRAMPRRALQAARAGAALRGPSTGSPLPFLEGGRIVADAVLGTDPAAQPYKPHHQQHQKRIQVRKQLGIWPILYEALLHCPGEGGIYQMLRFYSHDRVFQS